MKKYKLPFKKAFRYLSGVFAIVIVGAATYFTIMYAQGNNITPIGIENTGTIRLTVNPNVNFTVTLDDKLRQLNADNIIDNLEIGKHLLTVQSEGYNPWSQEIVVRTGLITNISIQLFPTESNISQLTTNNISDAIFSPAGNTLYYIVKDTPIGANVGIWRKNLNTGGLGLINNSDLKISNLNSVFVQALSENQLELIPSPNSQFILVRAEDRYFILNSSQLNNNVIQSEIKFSYPITNLQWLDDTNLLIESGNLIILRDTTTGLDKLIDYANTDNANLYAKVGNTVVFNKQDSIFQYNGTVKQLELENNVFPKNITNLIGTTNSERFLIETLDGLYLVDTNRSLLTKIGTFTVLSSSESGLNLIVQNNDAEKGIMSVEINISEARNLIETNIRSINISANIDFSTLTWSNNSNYFIYKEDNSIKAADKFGLNPTTLHSINAQKEERFIGISNNNSGIYLLLVDSSEIDTSSNRKNIYTLSFEE